MGDGAVPPSWPWWGVIRVEGAPMTWLIVLIALVVVAGVVGLVRKRRRHGDSERSGSQPMKIRDVTDHGLGDHFMTIKQFRD